MATEILARSAFAKAVGVSSSMVTKWIGAGMPKRADGLLDAAVCRAWLKANIQRRDEVGGETFSGAKQRKESALASLRELELSVRQGKLIDAGDAKRVWGGHVMVVRNRLLALPGKLAPAVAASADAAVCQELIRAEIYEALTELSHSEAEPVEPHAD